MPGMTYVEIGAEILRKVEDGTIVLRMANGQPPTTPDQVLDVLTPRGEVWPLMHTYWHLYPERLPQSDQPASEPPNIGDLRYNVETQRQEAWQGAAWFPV